MAGLKKNKDLDLRRYGKNLYTKALQSRGDGGSEGGEGTVDLESVYQFIKQQFLDGVPSDVVETFIIPEHFEDIIDLEGKEYEADTPGIWLTDNHDPITAGSVDVLFTIFPDNEPLYIVFGGYVNTSDGPLS